MGIRPLDETGLKSDYSSCVRQAISSLRWPRVAEADHLFNGKIGHVWPILETHRQNNDKDHV